MGKIILDYLLGYHFDHLLFIMKGFTIVCLALLTVLTFTQTCSYTSYNQTCSTISGKGVCCDCIGIYQCVLNEQQCCGSCGACLSSERCCSAGTNYIGGACLTGGATCCDAGTSGAYAC